MDTQRLCNDLKKIRQTKPVVHQITNYVTMSACAEITTIIGAAPIMAADIEEVADITKNADSLLLNMGTPDNRRFKAALLAGMEANKKGIPIVLDPVGVAASDFRIKNIKELLKKIHVSIIKGNITEIKALMDIKPDINKAVDSVEQIDNESEKTAVLLSQKYNCAVVCTGKADFVTDGKRSLVSNHGVDMLKNISGSGCMTGSVIAAFAAIEKDYVYAALFGVATVGISAEEGYKNLGSKDGPAKLKTSMFDALYNISNNKYEV
jgi:hydroxyethylthiazole kinase